MEMMRRHLVLFAHAPSREAREKGFAGDGAAGLFTSFGQGWWEAAATVGARLIVASLPEDRLGWQRCLGERRPHSWIAQRGRSFGARLESSGRAAEALGGRWLIVGGDVVPSARALEEAFVAMEAGADAVVAPAGDGGISLLALRGADLDLLRAIEPRRGDAFARLRARLLSRGRRIAVVSAALDVDGRRGLRALLSTSRAAEALRALTRSALARPAPSGTDPGFSLYRFGDRAPISLRGPPACG